MRRAPCRVHEPGEGNLHFAYGRDASGNLLYGDPDVHRFPITTLPEYEALFADAAGAVAIGEASPIYLECPQSADRIRSLIPDVRLVCTLRHPVDRAFSDYLMYIRRRNRPFDPAQDLSRTADWARPESRWMQLGRYHPQLLRYYERFPRPQLHVMLTGDLKRNAIGAVQELYRFIGVDPSFSPDFDTPHNVGGAPASPMLEKMFTSSCGAVRPGAVDAEAGGQLDPTTSHADMRPLPSLPKDLRAELTAQFRDDILRTSDLIGRSLDDWL